MISGIFKRSFFVKIAVLWLFVYAVMFSTVLAANVQAFRHFMEIEMPEISIPRTAELTLKSDISGVVAIYDVTNGEFVPSIIKYDKKRSKISVISASGTNPSALVDNNYASKTIFNTNGFDLEKSEIVLDINPSTKIHGIRLHLAKNVSLPNYVMVYDNDHARVLLARKTVSSREIIFPATNSGQIIINFEHIQPLEIVELDLMMDDEISARKLRFLAQPGHVYRLYTDAAYMPSIKYPEMPNLRDNDGLVQAHLGVIQNNPAYTEPDSDKDGVADSRDNCVSIANPDQKDRDNNGRGDLCDDFDKDGVLNIYDNCPNTPNYNQSDVDRDGIGDLCDKEESRFTEKYPWMVWFGVASVFMIFIAMFAVIMKKNGMTSIDFKEGQQD